MERKRNILILGAGYGGLSCGKRLSRLSRKYPELFKDYRIILVDQHDYQLFTPTLYEIATTPEEVANAIELKTIVTFPLNYALWESRVTFVQGSVDEIDFREKFVKFVDGQTISFEYLVIALGSETNYFGIPGLEEHSYPLKNLYDALRIRDLILSLFQNPPSPTLSFIVAGAGPTGVEFSGELSRWVKLLERTSTRSTSSGLSRVSRGTRKHCSCNITLVDAAPEILVGFGPNIITKARKRLAKLGVKIKTNAAIKEVTRGKAMLTSGESIQFDLMVWAGGTKAPEILTALPHKTEKKGRVEVSHEMLCISTDPHLDIGGKFFAVGDAACFYDPKTGNPIPGVARAAIEQGKIVAYNIMADSKRLPRKAYKPMNYPYIIPIGGKWAIARFGPIIIAGFFGWILKGLVELYYIVSVLPLGMALSIWIKGLFIFIKND